MRRSSVALLLASVALVSCGPALDALEPGNEAVAGAAVPPTMRLTSGADERPTAEEAPVLDLSVIAGPKRLRAAVSDGALPVYPHPEAHEPSRVLDATTILGTPTVVSIVEATRERMKVRLPGRPNGTTGWVDWSDVDVFDLERSVVVDLEDRTLSVFEDTELVFETRVGIGSPTSPTPTGDYFITDAAVLANASGPWGPFAFGLSARSNTVTEFNGGDGIIGIHGTNRPSSIGYAQSLGCIRLENAVMTELFELLAVGTPVSIQR